MIKKPESNMLKHAATIAGLMMFAAPLMAQPFEEGQHYQRISTPAAAPEDRVEVVEAFAYPCPACRNFMPHITTWEEELPDYVDFSRLPVALQPGWDLFARAFYTAEVMGVDKAAHEAMFHAVHDERRQFSSFEDIAEFYTEFDVEQEAFLNTSESFAVDSRMRQNRNEVRRFGIRGTPSVIVQGKWLVSPNAFESYQQMIEVIDFLVEREAGELGLDEAEESAAGASE
ncbi:MAG: thiol:disulfide interchange protein DsbA/DsbL [Wenzhouxiangella sp.]